MQIRITVAVEGVGEAWQVVDLHRQHRFGAAVGEVLEQIERSHPGVPLFEHPITVRSEAATGEVKGPVVIK